VYDGIVEADLPSKLGYPTSLSNEIGCSPFIVTYDIAQGWLEQVSWLAISEGLRQNDDVVYMIGHDHKLVQFEARKAVGQRVPYRLQDCTSRIQDDRVVGSVSEPVRVVPGTDGYKVIAWAT
jgi:hypothetical protein